MKVVGFSPNIAAAEAAKQGILGRKSAHRCWSHMLHLTADRSNTDFTRDYQWGKIKGEATNPVSPSIDVLIGSCVFLTFSC